ncbi:MAG: hypothetical protein MI861_09670 [Pirellulales bacterium]|nr:hypothetical protein [Pirellulales bacterium]
MYKTRMILTAGLAAVLACQTALAQQPPVVTPKVKPLMQMKLDRAKAILEGLTLEDYDKIARSARSLKLLSMESGWNVYQTEQYAAQSRDFRQSADLIAEAAEDKEVNRAALGYVALTVRCVECHNYMRKNKAELTKFVAPKKPVVKPASTNR